MKWKQLFDSTAELRILPNFGDRLVYSFPIMQFSASVCRRLSGQLCACNAHDEKKCSDTLDST